MPKIKKTVTSKAKSRKIAPRKKRDTSRSGYNEDQPCSRPGKKKI